MTNTVNTANQSSVYIRVGEISQLLDISEPTAYKVMHKLNKELAAMGYITLAGRTNRAYFMQKVCGCPAVTEGGV